MAGISMRELADLLGVSTASVSVALRGKSGISEETRRRILEEAHRQGYDMGRLSTPDSKVILLRCAASFTGALLSGSCSVGESITLFLSWSLIVFHSTR